MQIEIVPDVTSSMFPFGRVRVWKGLETYVTLVLRNGAVIPTLRDHLEMSRLRVAKGQWLVQIPANSSESVSEGRMLTSQNRAFSTMVPCKWRKQVVRYHLKSNSENSSSGDKVFVDKEAKIQWKNSPIGSLLGSSSHRKSSREEYVGLGFTLWYKRCLTMRWLGWLGCWWWQVGNQTENKTDLCLENRTQTTVEKQGALNCQGPQGNWYIRKLGQLLHMSKFSDYIIIL